MIEISNLLKKIFLIGVILLITFLPVCTSTVYAVSSWTGDTWEGESWSGSPWDGSDLQWKGKKWKGDSWEGNGTEKNPPKDGADGSYDWSHVPWYLEGWYEDGWSKDGYSADAWSRSGFNGDGTNGKPFMQEGYEGSPFTGSSWSRDGYWGYPGNAPPGNLGDRPGLNPGSGFDSELDANNKSAPFYESKGYKAAEYLGWEVIGGQAQLITSGMKHQRYLDAGMNHRWNPGLRMRGDLLVNGFKLAGVDNAITNTYDAGSRIVEGYEGYKEFKGARQSAPNVTETPSKTSNALRQSTKTSKFQKGLNKASKIAKAAPVEKVLSKFSVPGAMLGSVSSGFGTVDSINNTVDNWDNSSGAERTASVADIGENTGNFAMNAGTIALAAPVPGARVAGGIAIAGGAALWGVSRGVRFAANNVNKIKSAASKVGETAKKAGSAIKDGAKKAWDSVTGIFS